MSSKKNDIQENLANEFEATQEQAASNNVDDCIVKVKRNGRVEFYVEVSIRNLPGNKPVRPTDSGYAPTLVSARTLRSRLREDLIGKYLSPQVTLGSFFNETFEAELNATRSKRTAYNMITVFKGKILPKFGECVFSEITPGQLSEYIHIEHKELSPSTRDNYRKFLKAIFDSAIKNNIIVKNPIDDVKRPTDADKPQKALSYLTPKQLKLFYQFVFKNKHEFRFHFAVAGMTGVRVNEQRGLQWKDIQWDRNVIYVQRTYHRKEGIKTYTKNHDHRHVPLSPSLRPILLELKAQTNQTVDDFILPARRRWETDEQGKVLHDILAVLGLPRMRYYDFRSTFTMAVAEAKIAAHKIQEMLGHSTLEMTTRYLRKLGCNLEGALDEVDFASGLLADEGEDDVE